jgi:hypothetical protein
MADDVIFDTVDGAGVAVVYGPTGSTVVVTVLVALMVVVLIVIVVVHTDGSARTIAIAFAVFRARRRGLATGEPLNPRAWLRFFGSLAHVDRAAHQRDDARQCAEQP